MIRYKAVGLQECESKTVLYSVAFNELMKYLRNDQYLFKVDIAVKAPDGLYYYSLEDSVNRQLISHDAEMTVDENSFHHGYYSMDATRDEIKNLFRSQEEKRDGMPERTLVSDPIAVELRDDERDVRAYAALLACDKTIDNKEIYRLLFQCFMSFWENKTLDEQSASDDRYLYTIAKDVYVRFLSIKVYGKIEDKRKYELYEACCMLSCAPYENAQNHGQIGIFTESLAEREAFIRFERGVEISKANVRHIRKLLEMSDERGRLLIMDQGRIIGIYTPLKNFDGSSIVFCGNGKWQIFTGGKNRVLSFEANSFSMMDNKPRRVIEKLRKMFDSNVKTDVIIKFINEAEKQKHGTTIIILEPRWAAAESERLGKVNRATKIIPVPVSKKTVQSITAIDGAVILDPDGNIHAIGAILDGVAINPGNLGRGARYNSAVTYIDHLGLQGIKGMAIIVSVDESIDLYPNG